MNKEEQLNSDKKVLASLEAEYNRVRCHVDSVRAYITDLNFEDNVPDPQERYLMVEQLEAFESIQTSLINRIRFYRARVKRAGQCCQVCGDGIATHHCGQDADMDDACCQVKGVKPAISGESLRNLMGMQVCRCNVPCDVCAIDKRVGACVKLELVGGDYICLAPTPNTITE